MACDWSGDCGIGDREFRNAEECGRITDTFIYLSGHLSCRKVWIWIVPESAEAQKELLCKVDSISFILLPFQEYIPLCICNQSYTGTDIVLIWKRHGFSEDCTKAGSTVPV